MEKVELKIQGMHCTGCSTRLQKVLTNLEGVSQAEVSFENGNAKIEYNGEKISVKEIKEAVEDAGFKAE